MDISGAAVVAKALPLVEHLAFLSPGQGRNGGKPLHPAVEIGLHCFRPGLLQHDFRNPYMVGIPGFIFPPGKVPFVTIKPGKEPFLPVSLPFLFLHHVISWKS